MNAKILKRIAAMLLAIAMIFCIAGCGDRVDASKDLENVKAKGVLKVGMECGYAPFNWTETEEGNGAVKIANADGYANGYDVQIAKKIAESLGVELEVYAYKWEALIPAVDSGKLDCVIAGMSPTDERKETVDFSSNYYVSNLVIIVNKDGQYANAKSLADFQGAKVGAQDGTFHANALDQITNVDKKIMEDFTVLYNALTAKTIDGYVAEEPTAYAICESNEALTYVPLINNTTGFECSEGDTAIAVALRKGSSLNEEISKAIDAIDAESRASLMLNAVATAPTEE